MAHDTALADRIRARLPTLDVPPTTEKRMFGGVAWFVGGNLAIGVSKSNIMARLAPDAAAAALARPHVQPFGPAGRHMKGWIQITPPGFAADADFETWLRAGLAFAATLPPK